MKRPPQPSLFDEPIVRRDDVTQNLVRRAGPWWVTAHSHHLLMQIARDLETLRDPHAQPSQDFYRARVADYRAEYARLTAAPK